VRQAFLSHDIFFCSKPYYDWGLDVVSFRLRVSLIFVCLVVVDGISAPAVMSEEVNSKKWKSARLLTLTVRAEASYLKPARRTDVLSCDG
jgi:hypothetical protein